MTELSGSQNAPRLPTRSRSTSTQAGQSRSLSSIPPELLDAARFVLEALMIVGCFVVVIVHNEPADITAAFALLGVIAASIVRNLARPG